MVVFWEAPSFCSWEASRFFQRVVGLRGEAARSLIRFEIDGTMGRPLCHSLLEATGDVWISENMDTETAEEYVYVTGPEEGLDGEPLDELTAPPAPSDPVAALQEKVLELERLLKAQQAAGQQSQAVVPAAPPGPLLGGLHSVTQDKKVMETLRGLAGGAPGRLGAHGQKSRLMAPSLQADVAQQELQLGAVEDVELEQAIDRRPTDSLGGLVDAADGSAESPVQEAAGSIGSSASLQRRQPFKRAQWSEGVLGQGGIPEDCHGHGQAGSGG